MPELPDITVYIESLHRFFGGRPLNSLVIRSPLLLRTFDPPVSSVTGLQFKGSVGWVNASSGKWKAVCFLYFN